MLQIQASNLCYFKLYINKIRFGMELYIVKDKTRPLFKCSNLYYRWQINENYKLMTDKKLLIICFWLKNGQEYLKINQQTGVFQDINPQTRYFKISTLRQEYLKLQASDKNISRYQPSDKNISRYQPSYKNISRSQPSDKNILIYQPSDKNI